MAPREVYRDNLVHLDPGVKVPDVDDLLFEETTEYSDYHDKETITLDDAIDEARLIIETAVDFIQDDMEPEWAKAEEYYAGGSDLPLVTGRSKVSSTDVRDAIRALKPSIMRIFTQSDDIVEYFPRSVEGGPVSVEQTKYVNELFWDSGGYAVLQDAVHDTMLRKAGIIKAWWEETTEIEYMTVENLTNVQIDYLESQENVRIISVTGDDALQSAMGEEQLTVEIAILRPSGKLTISHVPHYEFFVDDVATGVEDARVIGQRRNIPIGDAIAMGFEEDDLMNLDGYDLEQDNFSRESEFRRGYIEEEGDEIATGGRMRKILLTEAYIRFDLDGLGIPQLYRFWMGGTSYKYLDHERVDEVPYSSIQIDPIPDAFFGRSIFDILKEDQDTATSLLRATCDNAHLANNKRLAVHETMVNIDDVMNNVLGYPIRVRAPGMIQEIGVQSSVGTMLPLLQYLDEKAQNKVGVTDAALGLDPDALQSTDKEAVQNTIRMSQGQVELMCRNIAETGLRQVFSKLLRLSIQYMEPEQAITVNNKLQAVDQNKFDQTMPMRVKVGLGNAGFDMKLAGLNNVLAQQKEIIATYGIANPIVTVQHIYNTIADLTRMMGLPDVTRYFNTVTPEVAKQIQDQAAEAASKDGNKIDPAQAIIQAETVKAKATIEGKMIDAQIDTQKTIVKTKTDIVEMLVKDDLARDKMAQDVEIESAKILGGEINRFAIAREQNKTRETPAALQSATGGNQ